MFILATLIHLLAPSAMAQQSCKQIFSHFPSFLELPQLKSEMRAQGLNLPTANHFGLIEATTTIAQARVVIIGDAHQVPGDPFQSAIRRAENADRAFLDAFVNPKKDIVLMERFPGSREANPVWSLFFQHKGIRSEGWDNAELNLLGHELFRDLIRVEKELLDGPPEKVVNYDLYRHFLLLRLAFEHVVIERRDEVLLQSIQKQLASLPADGKIFVIAGTEHAIDHYQMIYEYLQDRHVPYVSLRGVDKEIPEMQVGALRDVALDVFEVSDWQLDRMVLDFVSDVMEASQK